jgi:hypothetical protein
MSKLILVAGEQASVVLNDAPQQRPYSEKGANGMVESPMIGTSECLIGESQLENLSESLKLRRINDRNG